ncbi:hypothetical protein PV342_39680 [Streptomyces sp. PA03-3a]|nr:hypothetical protein [Streptomyces sp. PA03-3a]
MPSSRAPTARSTLFVSVIPGHYEDADGCQRGLAPAYVRVVRELNDDMADELGWEPMSENLEEPRREIDLETLHAGADDLVPYLWRTPEAGMA